MYDVAAFRGSAAPTLAEQTDDISITARVILGCNISNLDNRDTARIECNWMRGEVDDWARSFIDLVEARYGASVVKQMAAQYAALSRAAQANLDHE